MPARKVKRMKPWTGWAYVRADGSVVMRCMAPWLHPDAPDARSTGLRIARVRVTEVALARKAERPTPEMVERAGEALIAAMPQSVDIFIDGEDKPPARVMIDPWNVQDEANWTIE